MTNGTNGHPLGCSCTVCSPGTYIGTWTWPSSISTPLELTDETISKLAKAIAKEIARELAQEIEGAKR